MDNRPMPIPGEYYKHFKGILIQIRDICYHTESGECLVVYKCIDTDKIWARPLEMFMSEVDKNKYPDVTQIYRFEKMGD